MYRGYHESIDLGFWERPSVQCPLLGKHCLPFSSDLGMRSGLDTLGWRGCEGVLRGRSPWPGKGQRPTEVFPFRTET